MCNVATCIGIFSTAVTIYTCIQQAGGACIRNTSGLSQKYISEVNLPKHIKPFTESHFPVKPLFYPFSDNIKIGMKFRNINLHIIISFHYQKKIVIPFSVTLISWISIVGNPRSVSLLLPKVRPMVGLASLRCETDRVFPTMLNQL